MDPRVRLHLGHAYGFSFDGGMDGHEGGDVAQGGKKFVLAVAGNTQTIGADNLGHPSMGLGDGVNPKAGRGFPDDYRLRAVGPWGELNQQRLPLLVNPQFRFALQDFNRGFR